MVGSGFFTISTRCRMIAIWNSIQRGIFFRRNFLVRTLVTPEDRAEGVSPRLPRIDGQWGKMNPRANERRARATCQAHDHFGNLRHCAASRLRTLRCRSQTRLRQTEHPNALPASWHLSRSTSEKVGAQVGISLARKYHLGHRI
jgi:hypothetical protein